MTLIDRHEITATIGAHPVRVLAAETTLDRGWAPYVQGKLTIETPDVPGLLDPRLRPPVTVRHVRRHSDSKTVSEVSALYVGKTVDQVSAMHAGKTVDEMSSAYRTVWNAGGPHGVSSAISLTGWLTRAERSVTDPDVWVIEWCGDEQRAITRLATSRVWSPDAVRLRQIVASALARVGLDQTLGGTGDILIPLDDDGAAPQWLGGVSCWDYIDPIVSSAGFRVYADENGQWQLTTDIGTTGEIDLADAVLSGTDTWATDDGRFFDHAVITYEWETAAGVAKASIDAYSAGWVSGYAETIKGRPAMTGRARRIVDRAMTRALSQQWEAVSDYSIRPGMVGRIAPADSAGTVEAVTWYYPAARAHVTLADVHPI